MSKIYHLGYGLRQPAILDQFVLDILCKWTFSKTDCDNMCFSLLIIPIDVQISEMSNIGRWSTQLCLLDKQ